MAGNEAEAKQPSLSELLATGKQPETQEENNKKTPQPPSVPPPVPAAKKPQPPKAPPPVHLLAARKGFDGWWVKEGVNPPTRFRIQGEEVVWPNGDVHGLYNLGSGTCSLEMVGKAAFKGKFASEDRITWDNGSAWVRIGEVTEKKTQYQGACGSASAVGNAPVGVTKEAPKQTVWPIWNSSAAVSGNATASANLGVTTSAPAISSTAPKPVITPKFTPEEIEAKCQVLTGSWHKIGTNSRYRIQGNKIHWLDSGKVYSITPTGPDPSFPSCPRYVADIEGCHFICSLRVADQLSWNNGGVWMREADPTASATSSTTSGTANTQDAVQQGSTSSTAPSKPTVVHGKDGEELGQKIDQLLGQISQQGVTIEGCQRVGRPPSSPAVAAEPVKEPEKPPSPTKTNPPLPPPATPTAPTPPRPPVQQTAPVSGVYAQVQGQYAAAVAAGLRPTAVLSPAQQVAVAAAYQQAAVAQQMQAVQAAQKMATLVAGNAAAQATAQASRTATTPAATTATNPPPPTTPAPNPPPPKTPAPEEPAPKPPATGGPPIPSAPPPTTTTSGAKDAKAPAPSEVTSEDIRSQAKDALKKLSASSKSADALLKMKDKGGKEVEKKDTKAKDGKDDKQKEKDSKDTKGKDAKDTRGKPRPKASRSRSRSRSRGLRKGRRCNSRSRERKRSVKRSPKRNLKQSGKDRRGRRSPSSKSMKKNRGRERSRSKRKKKKSKSKSSSSKRSKSPVVPFVPRQLLGKVVPKVEGSALAPSVSKSASLSFPTAGHPASKSAPKRSEASAAAAAQLLERLARSGNDKYETSELPDVSADIALDCDSEQDGSDVDVPLGRWVVDVTDEEDEEEGAEKEEQAADNDATRSRLAELCGESSPPNGRASAGGREKHAEEEDEEDDDMEDSGPLPELSELRARAMAIVGGDLENSTSPEKPDKVGRPPAVSHGDRRKDQQGCVEDSLEFKNEANSIALVSPSRRVKITSTKGTEGVNLMAVMGFCAKFGEVVAMQLEGSGAEACALIEFRELTSAQACVDQRESECLRVQFRGD